VEAFLNSRIGFNTMSGIIEEILGMADFIPHPDIEELIITNRKTRELTEQLISTKY
jgi:1-deoxy-D-xylulose-5-phosphate reductoisomerase